MTISPQSSSELFSLAAGDGKPALQLARDHLNKAANLDERSGPFLYALARAEFVAGNFAAAETACEQSLAAQPVNYDALLLLAEARLRLKRPRDTWLAASQAIKLDKRREEGWLLAARAASEAGESQRAVECLEIYLKMNKGQLVGPLVYIMLARVYLEAGQPTRALEQIEQAHSRLRAMLVTPGPNLLALRARILNRLGQPADAFDFFQQAIQLNPEDPALHNELGETLAEHGKHAEALDSFRAALHLAPYEARYHCNAGLAAHQAASGPGVFAKRVENLQQQAIDLLEKATQLAPAEPRYWYELAMAYAGLRNFKNMKVALTQAIAFAPEFKSAADPKARYLRLMANTCQRLGDLEGARSALNQIMAALPDDHTTLNDLGELCYKLGDWGQAYNHFRQAELSQPDHPRYLANMSRVLLKLERVEEARDLIEEAFQVAPADTLVMHQKGAVLLEAGQADQALELLREAAGQEPDQAEFRYLLARAYLKLGMVGEAIHEYEESLANAPLVHGWHAELGEIYLQERSFLPALESLRTASQLEPSDPNYRYNLAIALAANGDVLGAIHTLREVMQAMTEALGAEWHYLEGRLLLELGRLGEALDSFGRAHRLEPDNPHYKVDLAKTLRLRGEPIDQVRNLLEDAIRQDPDGLRSFDELAYVYEYTNNPEAAIRTLEKRLYDVLETVKAG